MWYFNSKMLELISNMLIGYGVYIIIRTKMNRRK